MACDIIPLPSNLARGVAGLSKGTSPLQRSTQTPRKSTSTMADQPKQEEHVEGTEVPKDEAEAKAQGFGLSSYGDKAGNALHSGLSIVGNPLGKGLETVARPVGGIVGSVVDNGVMAAGRTGGGLANVGAGGMDTSGVREAWKEEQAQQKDWRQMQEPVGGQDQTADNPLGLGGSEEAGAK